MIDVAKCELLYNKMRAEGKLEEILQMPSAQSMRVLSQLRTDRIGDVFASLRSSSKLAEDNLLSIAEEPLFLSLQRGNIDSLAIQGWREDFDCLYLPAQSPLKHNHEQLKQQHKKNFISAQLQKQQRRKLPKCRAGKREKPAVQVSTQLRASTNQFASFSAPSVTKSLDLDRIVIGKVDFIQGTPLMVFQRKRSTLKPIYAMVSRPNTNIYTIKKTETRVRSKSTIQPKLQHLRQSNEIKTITYPTEPISPQPKQGKYQAKWKFYLKKHSLPSR